jgi:hypothetical protein
MGQNGMITPVLLVPAPIPAAPIIPTVPDIVARPACSPALPASPERAAKQGNPHDHGQKQSNPGQLFHLEIHVPPPPPSQVPPSAGLKCPPPSEEPDAKKNTISEPTHFDLPRRPARPSPRPIRNTPPRRAVARISPGIRSGDMVFFLSWAGQRPYQRAFMLDVTALQDPSSDRHGCALWGEHNRRRLT